LVKLFQAITEFGEKRREGETYVTWVAFREEPVAPYKDLISNYGKGNFRTKDQELAANQLLTLEEVGDLADYLQETRGWKLKVKEVRIPKEFNFPFPVWSHPLVPIKLYEDEDYDLDVTIAGGAMLSILPGLQLDEYKEAQFSGGWALFFFEDVFKKLGIELSEDQGIFSRQRLQEVYREVFYESGFYIHKFGNRDTLAEIKPEDHIAIIEEHNKIKQQIEEWYQK